MQGKLLRSLYPGINIQHHTKEGSRICGKNLLPQEIRLSRYKFHDFCLNLSFEAVVTCSLLNDGCVNIQFKYSGTRPASNVSAIFWLPYPSARDYAQKTDVQLQNHPNSQRHHTQSKSKSASAHDLLLTDPLGLIRMYCWLSKVDLGPGLLFSIPASCHVTLAAIATWQKYSMKALLWTDGSVRSYLGCYVWWLKLCQATQLLQWPSTTKSQWMRNPTPAKQVLSISNIRTRTPES